MNQNIDDLITIALNPWDMTVQDSNAIVAQLRRLAAIDSAVLGEVETIKSRFDGGTAGDNILQAVNDIKALLAIVGQQTSNLTAANASILRLRAEVEEQRVAKDAAEQELARIKGAGLEREVAPIAGRVAQSTGSIPSTEGGIKLLLSDRAALLDAVRVLTAERDEVRALLEESRKAYGIQMDHLLAALTDRDSARAEVGQLRESNRQLAENAQIATDSLLRRTQELAAAEEALRFKTAEADTLRKNRDALAHGETEALKMMAAEKERADKHAKAESFWIEERNRSERLYLAAGKKLATYERVIDVVRKMKVRKAEMDNDPTLRDLLQQNTILYPFVECLNSMEIPE